MHRWRTELFRNLVHSLEVELRVIGERQLHLLAPLGHALV